MSAYNSEKQFIDFSDFTKFIDWCKTTGRPYKAWRCLVDNSWEVVYGDRPQSNPPGALPSRGVAGIVK